MIEKKRREEGQQVNENMSGTSQMWMEYRNKSRKILICSMNMPQTNEFTAIPIFQSHNGKRAIWYGNITKMILRVFSPLVLLISILDFQWKVGKSENWRQFFSTLFFICMKQGLEGKYIISVELTCNSN